MNFQVFHVNPGKKLKKKDVNNDLSHFMSVFPRAYNRRLLELFCNKVKGQAKYVVGKTDIKLLRSLLTSFFFSFSPGFTWNA